MVEAMKGNGLTITCKVSENITGVTAVLILVNTWMTKSMATALTAGKTPANTKASGTWASNMVSESTPSL